MAREELVAGIRQAVNKGESLKDSMMSFLNAGYLKEDIEDAARIVQGEGIDYVPQKKEIPKEESVEKVTLTEIIPPAPVITQKVSDYASKEKPSMSAGKKIFLIVLLIFLSFVGISIAALLIFKEKFISILTGA